MTYILEYSPTLQTTLYAFWAIGSLIAAWFAPRPFMAYLFSVGLSAPAIGYSMVGYGVLEMGGILHALSAGLYVLPFYYLFHQIRKPVRIRRCGRS